MSTLQRAEARRAAWLLRCYPRLWRERYGEEFTAFLADEIAERPRSLTLVVDVVRCGVLARATVAGLAGHSPDADSQARAALAVLACATAAFMATGIAIWSQLTVGWQWSAPDAPATRVAMLVMSVAVLLAVLLAILAAVPIGWALCWQWLGGQRGHSAAPLLLVLIGVGALVVGSIHFGHGWPGTGGPRWSERGLVPVGAARFCWAATLWLTSYWAHPGALASFPPAEVAWMLTAPAACGLVVVGASRMLRSLSLSRRVLRFEVRLGIAATGAMAALLAGAGSWVISGGPAPDRLFAVGAIDVAGLIVMAVALVCAIRALERAFMVGRRRAASL